MYAADQTSIEMASLAIEGNVIDHTWNFIVTTEEGRPDTQAILLLGHIVFWYRPVYHPQPDGSIKLTKKYKSDLLQRSYQDIEKMLGLSKKQAQEAFKTLERLGFAQRELRTVEINGQKVSNILFIRINPQQLSRKRDEYLKKCICSYQNCNEGMTKMSQGTDKNVTYTESTTENTQREQQQAAPPSAAVFSCLKDLSLDQSAIDTLMCFPEERVKSAVAFLKSKKTPPDNPVGLLIWHCKQETAPPIPPSKEETVEKNKAWAKKREEEWDRNRNGLQVVALNESCEIIIGGIIGSRVFSYEKADMIEEMTKMLRV